MGQIFSLLFYILLTVGVAYFMHMAQENKEKRWIYAAVLLLTLVAGLRAATVGVDTQANIDAFMMLDEKGFEYVSREWAFYGIAFILMNIFHNTSVVFLVFGFLIYFLVFERLWDLRRYADLRVSGGLFVLNYFGGTMNVMRQYIAVAIVFYATRYIKKGKMKIFLILTAIAFFFHISAFVGFFFLLFYVDYQKLLDLLRSFTRKQLMITVSVFAGLGLIMAVFFFTKYGSYFEDISGFGLGLMSVVRLLMFFGTYFIFKRCSLFVRSSKYRSGANLIFAMTAAGFIIGLTSGILENASRMGYYFRIYELGYYGMILKEGQMQQMIRLAVLAALCVLGIYGFYTYGGILPYQTVLF